MFICSQTMSASCQPTKGMERPPCMITEMVGQDDDKPLSVMCIIVCIKLYGLVDASSLMFICRHDAPMHAAPESNSLALHWSIMSTLWECIKTVG